MPFLPRSLIAASPCLLLSEGRGTVISHSDCYSIFKVQWKGLSLIPTGRGQTHPLNGKNIWEFEKSFHLFPLGRAKLSGVFEKFFVLQKILSLIWTKGAEMHTHFWGFLRKIFNRWKYPLTYLELQSQMTPYFTEKRRKYFLVAGALFCFPQKVSSLIPTERSQMHTLNLKKFFILSLIWNWEAETHPAFTKILKNIFFNRGPWFCLLKKSPHLFGIGMPKRNLFFRKNRKTF